VQGAGGARSTSSSIRAVAASPGQPLSGSPVPYAVMMPRTSHGFTAASDARPASIRSRMPGRRLSVATSA